MAAAASPATSGVEDNAAVSSPEPPAPFNNPVNDEDGSGESHSSSTDFHLPAPVPPPPPKGQFSVHCSVHICLQQSEGFFTVFGSRYIESPEWKSVWSITPLPKDSNFLSNNAIPSLQTMTTRRRTLLWIWTVCVIRSWIVSPATRLPPRPLQRSILPTIINQFTTTLTWRRLPFRFARVFDRRVLPRHREVPPTDPGESPHLGSRIRKIR